MKPEVKKLIQEATAQLHLQDIILVDARFERPSTPPEDPDEALLRQYKRSVGYSIENDGRTSGVAASLNVGVALGTRLVRGAGKKGAPKSEAVVILIEAQFLAIYDMTNEVSEEAIKPFAEINAVHNVWPFWRHHVFDICQRAKLPILDIPLIAGIPND